jgi:hypothetical protein
VPVSDIAVVEVMSGAPWSTFVGVRSPAGHSAASLAAAVPVTRHTG